MLTNTLGPVVVELGCEPKSAQRQGPRSPFHAALSPLHVLPVKCGIPVHMQTFPRIAIPAHIYPSLRLKCVALR